MYYGLQQVKYFIFEEIRVGGFINHLIKKGWPKTKLAEMCSLVTLNLQCIYGYFYYRYVRETDKVFVELGIYPQK